MSAPVRIVVAGAGAIGRTHLDLIAANAEAALVAIVDPAPTAQEIARARGVRHFADLDTCLAATSPDAVILATPNALHVPQAMICLARGLPVLVEKPVADSIEAGERLAAAAADSRVPVLVGHHRRHGAAQRRAVELVRGGAIGRVTAISALSLFLKPDDYFDTAWRRERGGGPVLINAIHVVDDLRALGGDILEVKALTSSAARGFVVEDTAAVAVRFASGALGTLTISDIAAAPWSWELTSGENPFYPQRVGESCYFVAGTEGALAVPAMTLWQYRGTRGWSHPLDAQRIAIETIDPMAAQFMHFLRVVRGEEPPRVTAADALLTLKTTLAILESAG